MARSWVREPLVHFLLAGGAIFLVTSLWPGGGGGQVIRIHRQQLEEFLRARAEISDRSQFEAYYTALPQAQRAALIRRVAQDEALYREGLAIGLDRADPLVRQRIVQQMRQVLGDEVAADTGISEAGLEAFYQAHREDYRQGDAVDFSHVFFAAGEDALAAQRRARAELERLRSGRQPATAATAHGERFLYETTLRAASQADVTAKFGTEFWSALRTLPAGQWQGPLRSEHGWHLVYVTAHVPGHLPTVQELGTRLHEDALAAQRQQATNAAVERVLGDYRVETVDLPE